MWLLFVCFLVLELASVTTHSIWKVYAWKYARKNIECLAYEIYLTSYIWNLFFFYSLWIRFSIRLYKIHWGTKESNGNENVHAIHSSRSSSSSRNYTTATSVNHQSDDSKCNVILRLSLSLTHSSYSTPPHNKHFPSFFCILSIWCAKNLQHQSVGMFDTLDWSHLYI